MTYSALIPSYRVSSQIEVFGMWGDALTVSKPNSMFKSSDAVSAMYYMRRSKG